MMMFSHELISLKSSPWSQYGCSTVVILRLTYYSLPGLVCFLFVLVEGCLAGACGRCHDEAQAARRMHKSPYIQYCVVNSRLTYCYFPLVCLFLFRRRHRVAIYSSAAVVCLRLTYSCFPLVWCFVPSKEYMP